MDGENNPHCRIGRVTLHGGADLKIFHNDPGSLSRDMAEDVLNTTKRIISDCGASNCGGFALVVWDREGRTFQDWNTLDATVVSGVGASHLPGFVAENLRRMINKRDIWG